ncbi:MAG: hypothetical protein ACFKPT_28315 [Gloeotrichia echinulata GP01]
MSKLIRFFGTFYGELSSKSLKALLCRYFIENIGHNRLEGLPHKGFVVINLQLP